MHYRIQVGTDEEAGGVGLGGEQDAAQITGAVNVRVHSSGPHPAANESVNAMHGRRQECARGFAGDFGAESKFAAARNDLLRPVGCNLITGCAQALRLTRASM